MSEILLVIFRSVAVYIFIILAIRLFGKKELAQLSVIDLVFILLISNAVQNAMIGTNTTLYGGLIAATSLFIANYLLKFLFLKSKTFSSMLQGNPLILIYKGKIIKDHLTKAQITTGELEAAVREHGVKAINEVDLAVLEVDGNISVLSAHFQRQTTKKLRAHKILSKTT